MLDLKNIRKYLHSQPELSGTEEQTSQFIKGKVEQFNPHKVITNLGGHGLAVIFKAKRPGPCVLFRAELDALPVQETGDHKHKSETTGVSHACGHDGHMTILLGLAERLQKEKENLKGKTILLFQPAEETAQGAIRILDDSRFNTINPDFVFALHNLPGFSQGEIILKKGVFASASRGLIVKLTGKTSHAGEPEKGKNPVLVMTRIIEDLIALPQLTTSLNNAALITIIHANLGKVAFGTSPGSAQIMATFRTYNSKDMEILVKQSMEIIKGTAKIYNHKCEIRWVEEYPATENDDRCVDIIETAAKNRGCAIRFCKHPFPWSEDFGFFTQKFKGSFFGIGSGKEYPQLHSENYDFPDEILEQGIAILGEITKQIQM